VSAGHAFHETQSKEPTMSISIRQTPPTTSPAATSIRVAGRRDADTDTDTDTALSIRLARDEDDDALARLAALDSSRVPTPPVLVAEMDGVLWAVLSLRDGCAIADPFRSTADIARLLAFRAAQTQEQSS
jgi:hypothetical protein